MIILIKRKYLIYNVEIGIFYNFDASRFLLRGQRTFKFIFNVFLNLILSIFNGIYLSYMKFKK